MSKVNLTNEEAEKLFCDEIFFAGCNKEAREKLKLHNPVEFPFPPEDEIPLARNEPEGHDPTLAKQPVAEEVKKLISN